MMNENKILMFEDPDEFLQFMDQLQREYKKSIENKGLDDIKGVEYD